jgi:hypothetical protein
MKRDLMHVLGLPADYQVAQEPVQQCTVAPHEEEEGSVDTNEQPIWCA